MFHFHLQTDLDGFEIGKISWEFSSAVGFVLPVLGCFGFF